MKVYISGPITGIDGLNRPAFDAVATALRRLGYVPLNPHDVGDVDQSWAWNMRRLIVLMMQADCLVQLPGFTKSAGAVVENNLAAGLRIPRIALTANAVDVQAEATLRHIARGLAKETALPPVDPDGTMTPDPTAEALKYR